MDILGLHLLAKAVLVFAVSFFVLLGVNKTESKGLKQFGRIIAFAMWVIAVVTIVSVVYCSIMSVACPGKASACKMKKKYSLYR